MANPYKDQKIIMQPGVPSVRMPTFSSAATGVPSVRMPYIDPLRNQARRNVFGPPVVNSPKDITPRMIRETQKGPKLPPYKRAVPSPQDRATLSSQEPRLFNMESNPTRTKALSEAVRSLPKPDRVGKAEANAFFGHPIFPVRSHLEPVLGESLDGRLRETFNSDPGGGSPTYLDTLAEANKSLPAPKRRLRTNPALIPKMPSVSNSLAARPSPVEMDTTLDSLTGISTNLARPTELVGGGPSSEMGRSSGGRPRLQLGSPPAPSVSDLNAFTTEGQRELEQAQGAAKLYAELAGIGTSPKPMTKGPNKKQQAALDRGAAASSFLRPGGELTKLYERQEGGNSGMIDSSDPIDMLMPAPRRPSLGETEFMMEDYGLGQGPTRSEKSRSTMQPGSMGFNQPVEDDGYAFKGSGATPGVRFDAGMFRNRQDQIDFLDKKVADHMAEADENGVVTTPSGATRTIDSDPSSPTYGKMSVTGAKQAPRTSAQKAESAARRSARQTGSVYTDDDGKITDYGMLNRNRDAFRERQAERKDRARELRTRRAQLRNYGSTGGVIVAPGGGIGGPLTVGMQRTFGPNMSLNQATAMAQGQLDRESRYRDAQERQDKMIADKQRRQDVSTYIETAKEDPALARQFAKQVGLEGFQGKTTAETAQEMENRSAMRTQLSEDPQSILDIEADITAQHPNDPAAQEEMRLRLGITPDMLQSAMRRTQQGALGDAYDAALPVMRFGLGQAGESIDDYLGTNMFGAIGQGIGNYFFAPSDDEIDQQEQRRGINRRMNQRGQAAR